MLELLRFYCCVSAYTSDNDPYTWMLYDWLRGELVCFDGVVGVNGAHVEHIGRLRFWLTKPQSWEWCDSWQSPKVSISQEPTAIWWERVKRIDPWKKES